MITPASPARWLRQRRTDAEKILWSYLRRKQLGGWRFRQQHAIGGFIVDLCCPQARLAIELDGGHHMRQEADDQRRTQVLNHFGYRVLRFWNHEVLRDPEAVVLTIWRTLEEIRATISTPTPPAALPPPPRQRGGFLE